MAMLRGTYRRGAAIPRFVRGKMRPALALAGSALICGPLAAGCVTSGPTGLSIAGPGAPTVAFESIDGPPEPVFRKLVAQLTEEANARRIAVVSREVAAEYRVRGYVAAHVRGKRTTIAWVWDIYNANQQRAMRIAGEVPGTSALRAWAAADDQAVGVIARDGMDRLATFLAEPPSVPPSLPSDQEPPREVPGPNVAFAPAANALSFAPSLPRQ
jgi:hypothetical protein